MTVRHHLRTVLVTGGCGFIGSHLIRHLLRSDPACVIVIFDTYTYAGSAGRLTDVAERHKARYRFVWGDMDRS